MVAQWLGFTFYLVFLASWFLHLTERVPLLGTIRFDLLLVIVTALLLVGGLPSRVRAPGDRRIFWSVSALSAVAVLIMPLAWWPSDALQYGLLPFLKGIVFFYFTVALVTTRRRLAALLVVFIGCQALRIVEPVYLHLFGGYWGSAASMANWGRLDRLSSSPADVVNPDGFAFVIVTFVCFAHYLAPLTRTGRLLYPILLAVSMYALVLTASRTGLICLAVVLVLMWFKSRHKLLMAGTVLAALVVTIPLLPPDLADRYLSLVSSNTRNAKTAQDRSQLIGWNLAVALRHPLFGYGLGMSKQANAVYAGEPLLAHQVHVETFEELGITGLAFFLAFQFCLASTLWKVSMRDRPADRFSRAFMPAVQVWFATVVVYSFAAFGLSSFEWYLLAALVHVADRVVVVRRPAAAIPPAVVAMRRVA